MDKRFNLQTLQELSSLKLDQATRHLGKLIAGEKEAGQRLELLIQYRNEYHGRFLAAASNGLNPEVWRNYQKFITRLDEAVEQARNMVNSTKQQTAAGQKNWLDKRGKVKAFDTLAHRFRARVAYEEARSEQKQADEHAARFFDPEDKEE